MSKKEIYIREKEYLKKYLINQEKYSIIKSIPNHLNLISQNMSSIRTNHIQVNENQIIRRKPKEDISNLYVEVKFINM